jgi:hypothetical protein
MSISLSRQNFIAFKAYVGKMTHSGIALGRHK